MTLLGLSEKGQTFKYVILTTKIVQVLQKFGKNNQLEDNEKKILARGAELIEKIIEGAHIVDGVNINNLSPTQEGLSAYGYALSTIESLNLFNKVKRFTDFFNNLLNQLRNIECGKKENIENINFLKEFFLALGNSFRSDISQERYTTSEEEYPILS
jgi:hypothetical protein